MIRYAEWLIVLTIWWAVFSASLQPMDLALGFAASVLVLWLVTRALGPPGELRLVARTGVAIRSGLHLGRYLVGDALAGAWVITRLVLAPSLHPQSAIIRVPIGGPQPLAATVAHLLTFTPASTVIAIEEDGDALYLHEVDLGPARRADAYRRRLQDGYVEGARRLEP